MLDILKFVRAAVCKQGHNPAQTHFRITGGTIQANNGRLAIQCPFPSDLDCTPHAGQFFKAIEACKDVISMNLEAGKLVVRSGRFKTRVNCCENASFPRFFPSGPMFPVPQPIIPTLRKLFPFVADDERRPWACGVQFSNNSAIVTNSICIVEHWLPFAFPVITNIPRDAIAELLRLKLEPVGIQASSAAVVFHLPEGAWFACRPIDYKWPDVQAVFDKAASYQGTYINAGELDSLLEDVEIIKKFVDEFGAVHFHKGVISTHHEENENSTIIQCPYSPGVGAFRADQLIALRGMVDRIGFGAYPDPVPFYSGNLLRGVMAGFKV
jgi:hypothetical protein